MAEEKSSSASSNPNPIIYLLMIENVIKGFWLILLASLVAAMGAYVFVTQTYSPVYSTETIFVVSAKNNNSTVFKNISAANNLAQVFTNVINSDIMKKTVYKTVGPQVYSTQIVATPIEETNLLRLKVTASDPLVVFKVSKAIIKEHNVVTNKILENAILQVLKEPVTPFLPQFSMQRTDTIRKAMLITMAGVAALLALISYMSGTVKDEKDIGTKIESRLLATLFHEKKYKTFVSRLKHKKSGLIITNPFVSFGYIETVKALRTKIEYQSKKNDSKVIMFTSVLENEGKSTISANLSIALAQKGKKVLLIDADLRKPSIYKLFNQKIEKENEFVLKSTAYGLNLLLVKASNRTVVERALSSSLKKLIPQLREQYDYIFIDTPPMSVASDAERIAELSDANALIVRFNYSKVEDISNAVSILRDSGGKFMGCIFNDAYAFGVNIGKKSYGYGYGYGYGHKDMD